MLLSGAPDEPSAPSLVHVTAVSITMSWTAGFDGGSQQSFTILYTNTHTNTQYQQHVITDSVTSGDVVVYKLKDTDTILSDTTYSIKIKAENNFKPGLNISVSKAEDFTTLGNIYSEMRGNTLHAQHYFRHRYNYFFDTFPCIMV